MDERIPLVAIVGPTAVGKTALAVELAASLGGEIISADSRQVYRYMDIGTAKPSLDERRRVPYHLVDVADPDEEFTLARYQDLAFQALREVHGRGKLPFLVGGTGLYVRAVLEGFSIPRVGPNPTLRERLYQRAEEEGAEILHGELAALDQVAAARIDPRNVRRVVRALEVCLESGVPISQSQRREAPPLRAVQLGLTRPREELYRRIDRRVDQMMEAGLLAEVSWLREQGYGCDLPAMSGVGYRELCSYLRGELDLASAVRAIKRETRRIVRKQYNWFRLDDTSIRWLVVGEDAFSQAREAILSFLKVAAQPIGAPVGVYQLER